MAASISVTESMIQGIADAKSFERGRDYYERGAVLRLTRRGDQLQAEVEGSDEEPYQVRVTLGPDGIASADCTCPYDWGGACKHIVAALLASLHDPETVEERPPLETLLAGLDPKQMHALLLAVAEHRPELTDWIEAQIQILRSGPPASAPAARRRPSNPDPASLRRQVRDAIRSLSRMRSSEAYWQVGSVVNEVSRLVEPARAWIEAGDGRSALVILEAVTQAYLEQWTELDDSDAEASGFFRELGELWTEALLTADLTPAERRSWAGHLAGWQDEVEDYGVDEAFGAAQTAAAQGWEDPDLQRVLQGETAGEGRVGEEDALVSARLNVLERQGRTEEYLRLARAAGQSKRCATMLVQLGRVPEAVEYGLSHLATADEALALAKALHTQGAREEALRVAEHGLGLDGGRATLARWLRDQAREMGQTERALNAARVVMQEWPTLADFQAIPELAGEQWPALREELLDGLSRRAVSTDQVEILLHEGRTDDALALVKPNDYYTLVEKVADAVVQTHPDWVIQAARAQAEPIMGQGRSQHYHHAIRWLQKARAAFLAAGREPEWRAYLNSLIAQHRRKYSLVPSLEALR